MTGSLWVGAQRVMQRSVVTDERHFAECSPNAYYVLRMVSASDSSGYSIMWRHRSSGPSNQSHSRGCTWKFSTFLYLVVRAFTAAFSSVKNCLALSGKYEGFHNMQCINDFKNCRCVRPFLCFKNLLGFLLLFCVAYKNTGWGIARWKQQTFTSALLAGWPSYEPWQGSDYHHGMKLMINMVSNVGSEWQVHLFSCILAMYNSSIQKQH